MEHQPIQLLDAGVVGKIAAGEVVERPASAIKELVENSIDAGATAITVEIRDGGISYFRVTDNGCGIPTEQIKLAFARHATSKIRTESDLFEVGTLGFRGEALFSIASVGKVQLTTRTRDMAYAASARVEGGVLSEVQEAAGPLGTTLVVRELFFNTPVRLKFLKKPAYEATLVADMMMRLVLSHPEISFRYVQQGKTIYQSAGDGKLASALFAAYGKEAVRQMRYVSGHENGLLLEGYVGVGEMARGNRLGQTFFINGRYFRSPLLSKALEAACQGGVMVGHFPSCVLYLQLQPEQVDVNVHPNKLEVRFQRPDSIAAALEHIVRDTLAQRSVRESLEGVDKQQDVAPVEKECIRIQSVASEPVQVPTQTAPILPQREEAHEPFRPIVVPSSIYSKAQLKESATPYLIQSSLTVPPAVFLQAKPAGEDHASEAAAIEILPKREAPTRQVMPIVDTQSPNTSPKVEQLDFAPKCEELPLRFIGIAFATYLLFESGERLLLVDQHAAHERILYDRFMAKYGGQQLSQQLLQPQLVQLSQRECAQLLEFQDELAASGFEFEPFDDGAISVHAVPSVLGQSISVKEAMLEALQSVEGQRGQAMRERLRSAVMQMACKHAIKAGDTLKTDEAMALLRTLLTTDAEPTCPHGRPIVTEISRRELEKRFKRIQ